MSERVTFHHSELYEDSLTNPHAYAFRHNATGKCIIANGCFDILHKGHLHLLSAMDTIAYVRGLRPVVALNSDASIQRLKGLGRPIVPQKSRSFLINHLKWPLTVVIFDEETPQALMNLLRPRIVLKGDQYRPDQVVKHKDSEVICVPMLDDWSTSRLVGDTR